MEIERKKRCALTPKRYIVQLPVVHPLHGDETLGESGAQKSSTQNCRPRVPGDHLVFAAFDFRINVRVVCNFGGHKCAEEHLRNHQSNELLHPQHQRKQHAATECRKYDDWLVAA